MRGILDRKQARTMGIPDLALSPADKQALLQLVRQTLVDYLGNGTWPECQTDNPSLQQKRAVFVTLRRCDTGDLRGCRGEFLARRSLIEAVAHMAIVSAVDDPRVSPVTLDEVPELHIEISVLTPLRPIRLEEIEIGRHGLMIVSDGRTGLLLPHVPVRYGWDVTEFVQALCRKADLPHDTWQKTDAQLFGFEAETWAEEV